MTQVSIQEMLDAKRKREEREKAQQGAWLLGTIFATVAATLAGVMVAGFAGGVIGGCTLLAVGCCIYAAAFGPKRGD